MGDIEKDEFGGLGFFYLGREVDEKGTPGTKLLYESKDLVTHAVVVGMTGSGKTGLGISLLEEAAIDGIPAIVVDPKGDLGNLLLTFPELRGEDFRPWIDEDEARRQGMEADAFAEAEATRWKKGLAGWGEDGARIGRLREAADFAIYTPGSDAGLGVSLLRSLDAPAGWADTPEEDRQERIAGLVSSILALAGIDADPVQSKEHILLCLVVADAWGKGKSLRLEDLVRLVLTPPFDTVGALSLEEFFPAKDRSALSMKLNALVASPAMSRWKSGEPLDVGAMLRTKEGKPRVSVFTISHLSDAERMFFVSLLATEVVGWMRRQSGTTSLRAIFFMDEIFGFFPPTAMPPSKRPMLTLLKQGRAFGLGSVLATQNPVDLDYKGLTNAGTWFVGRLQAERDKNRLLDGLETASAAAGRSLDRAEIDRTLSALPARTFLMNNVHDDAPVLFQSRWALSYLRGPLTKDDVAKLMKGRKAAAPVAPKTAADADSAPRTAAPGEDAPASSRPALPPEIPQLFVPARASFAPGELSYRPCVVGSAAIAYHDAKAGVDSSEELLLAIPFGDGAVDVAWDDAQPVDAVAADLGREPEDADATFERPPAPATKAKSFTAWKKSFADSLYRTRRLDVLKSESTGETSKPGESERDFRARLGQALREARDEEIAKLRADAADRLASLEQRLRRVEERVEREKRDRASAGLNAAISVGAAVLGAFLGRKAVSATSIGRVATAARGMGRTMREQGDVAAAEDSAESVRAEILALDEETKRQIDELSAKYAPEAAGLATVSIKPKKSDVEVKLVALGWRPVRKEDGKLLG